MSSTMRSYGFIAVLKTRVPEEKRNDLSEQLYDEKSNLGVIPTGYLIFLDYNRHKPLRDREDFYGLWFNLGDKDPQDLVKEAAKYELEVDESTIRPFNCIWYTGGDCPLWGLTKAEYLEQTGQQRDPQYDWVCPDCGSSDVQAQAWVEMNNTSVITDMEGGDNWCPHCESNPKYLELRKDYKPKES